MTKFCISVDIHDVITYASFCDDRLRGLGVAMGRIFSFPIDLRRRPYNTLALPCECVIKILGVIFCLGSVVKLHSKKSCHGSVEQTILLSCQA